MVDAVSNANSYATSAIAAADVQIAAVTDNIANEINTATPTAPFGSSVVAPPVTGTQPSNAASQVFQALQTDQSTGSGSNAAAPSVSHSGEYDLSYKPDSSSADAQGLVATPDVNAVQQSVQLATAASSFAANVNSLQTASVVNHRVLDLTT